MTSDDCPRCTQLTPIPRRFRQEIHDKVTSLGFEDCKVYVSNVDSQSSASGGIIIQVLGEMSNKNGPWRKFCQTFFLAEQPNGYFVLNDIFRYLKDEEETEEEAEEVEEDIRRDEETARAEGHDVAGAQGDITAVLQPGATPHVQPVVAAPDSDQPTKPSLAAIGSAPTDNSVTEIESQPAADAAPAAQAEAAETPKEAAAPADAAPTQDTEAATATGAEPAEAAKQETAPAAVSAAGPAASSEPAAPAAAAAPAVEAAEPPRPAEPPKPKTWANLAASNVTTWGSAVRADAKGISSNKPAVTASSPAAAAAAAAGAGTPAAGRSGPSAGGRGANNASGSNGAGAGSAAATPSVFIKSVQPEHVTEASLRSALERNFGPLRDLQVLPSRGCAFADFQTVEAARKALAASASNGGVVVGEKGWKVLVEEKRPKPTGAAGAERGAAPGGASGGRGGRGGARGGRGGAAGGAGRGGAKAGQ